MNTRNRRFLVAAAVAAIAVLSGAAFGLRPFDAFAGATVTETSTPATSVVSRREYLARLVAETAARAADDAARHPAQRRPPGQLPDDDRIAGSPTP